MRTTMASASAALTSALLLCISMELKTSDMWLSCQLASAAEEPLSSKTHYVQMQVHICG